MLILCIVIYLVIAIPVLIMFWAMLVVAKWDDTERGYDLLEDRISTFE